jgi:hypothetical protein
MKSAKSRSTATVTLLIVLSLVGCTTFKPIDLESFADPGREIDVGDTVLVQTSAGQTVKFTVTAIDSNSLHGKDHEILFDDIEEIQVRQSQEGINRVLAGGMLIALAVVAAASGGFSSGRDYDFGNYLD